ncbi:YcaO-like family protein [Nonomuraea sp. NPDC050310]|uniref:YcaO-like family protein n=1 Tax=unclassified Nonomuraea TaxID=2593643 RepID=UPI0033D74BC2
MSGIVWLPTQADDVKVRLPGTDRAKDPAQTLAMARGAAGRAGITRVADLTWLDTIGIPTYQAIRPTARTLAVSQGKGITAELAKLSAMMEAIELWHAEQPFPPALTAPPREVAGELGYDLGELPRAEPSLLHDGLPIEWVAATSLADGKPALLPKELVTVTMDHGRGWHAPVFAVSSNGLASGNTLVEAVLHALYEVIERDAVSLGLRSRTRGVRADPASLGSPVVDRLCELLARAGVDLEVRWMPSATGLPCFLAEITCPDYPMHFRGFGCHLSSEIALTRAVTEAAQARLAYISGARDDLHANAYASMGERRRAGSDEAAEPIARVTANASLVDDLRDVVGRATAAFGHAPLFTDLTRDDVGVPVARVVAPGCRLAPEEF